MKRLFLSLTILLSAVILAPAQEIKSLKPDTQDILNVLDKLGNKIFAFDINQLANTKYNVSAYVDEYKMGKIIKSDTINLRSNIGHFKTAKKLTIYITTINDSSKIATIDLENICATNAILTLQPLTNNKDRLQYAYESRPFEIKNFKPSTTIPLMLYGSFWYDEQFDIHRFCGENELSPDMSSDMLTEIPHYYLISVKFDEATN